MKLIFNKISLASDHAGFNLKEIIKKKLIKNKIRVIDFGPYNKDVKGVRFSPIGNAQEMRWVYFDK